MPRLHHVNLGVPPDLVQVETRFLVEVLGYRRLELPAELEQRGAVWFEADDGTQVHLSVDPEHRPAARAHTAIEVERDGHLIESRLEAAGIAYASTELGGGQVIFCQDPAGNRWELRR